MTVASYERDLANAGACLFPVVPKIIASTTPATPTSTRPETRPTPHQPRSQKEPDKPLDIPTSFNRVRAGATHHVNELLDIGTQNDDSRPGPTTREQPKQRTRYSRRRSTTDHE